MFVNLIRFVILFVLVPICLLFTSCNNLADEQEHTKKAKISKIGQGQKKHSEYQIKGVVNINHKNSYFYINSNLIKGTKLVATVNDKQVGEGVLDKDGHTVIAFDLPYIKSKEVKFIITLRPEMQSDAIKKIYGQNGEVFKGDYIFKYKHDGESVIGLKAGVIDNSDFLLNTVDTYNIVSWKALIDQEKRMHVLQ